MKLIASNIHHFKWNLSHDNFNPDFANEKTMKEVESLFRLLRSSYTNLAEDKDEEKYILYYRAPKGKCEDDEEYRHALADNELDEAEDIKRGWDRDYPDRYTWFSLAFFRSFYKGINYYLFYLDGNQMFSLSDEKYSLYDGFYSFSVKVASRIVARHIKINEENKFQKMFDKTFGYGKRRGIIEYKQAWTIYPSLKKEYLSQLKGLDLERLFQEACKEEVTYFPRLSSGRYFDICKIGYLGVDKAIDKEIDSKTLFNKKADGRTFGLQDIDVNSEEEFDKWFAKNGEHPDHAFEIFPGRSFYRGDFWIDKNEKGYYLSLSGRNYYTEINVLKFYNSLLKKGIKVKLCDRDLYQSRIEGTAVFAIENEDEWCYGYTTVFGESYIDSIHIKDFPKLIPYVQWEEVKMSEYIKAIEEA